MKKNLIKLFIDENELLPKDDDVNINNLDTKVLGLLKFLQSPARGEQDQGQNGLEDQEEVNSK